MQQRRKDRNDPMLYPPYFIRNNFSAKDARIDGFSKKVMGSQVHQRRQREEPKKIKSVRPALK